jgi:hypothetical protein
MPNHHEPQAGPKWLPANPPHLEGVFRELRLVQDAIMVCGGVRESGSSDLDGEVEHVLRRCGSDRLFSMLKTLTEIVERFGGNTEMSEASQEETS